MVFLMYLLIVIMLIQKGSLAALHRLSISRNIKYLLFNNSKNTYQHHKKDTQGKKQRHSLYHYHFENEERAC